MSASASSHSEADISLPANARHHTERELGLLGVVCSGSLSGRAVGCLPRFLRLPDPVQYRLMPFQYPAS